MDNSTLWWVMAGVMVAVELATGTFYLLMMALGAVAGAIAAQVGLAVTPQIGLAALVAALAAGGLHLQRKQSNTGSLAMQEDPDLSLDLGQTVVVATWQADGTAQVSYRGAVWSARLKIPLAQALPEPGAYRICAMQGNHLLLEKV